MEGEGRVWGKVTAVARGVLKLSKEKHFLASWGSISESPPQIIQVAVSSSYYNDQIEFSLSFFKIAALDLMHDTNL